MGNLNGDLNLLGPALGAVALSDGITKFTIPTPSVCISPSMNNIIPRQSTDSIGTFFQSSFKIALECKFRHGIILFLKLEG
jgi:hypothetical protein